jgi:hypothetical protein
VLETPASRLEDPLFHVGEASQIRREGLEDVPVQLLQVPVELRGGPVQRGAVVGRRRREAAPPGVPQELLPHRVRRSRPVGGEEGEGLASPQGVPPGHLGQAELLLPPEGRERQGHGDRHPAGIQAGLQLRGEPAVQPPPLLDPALPVAEQLTDRGRAQAILIHVGGDDPGLVHGARCPPRGVRLQQPRLVQERRGILDDHGDLPQTVRLPLPEPLEAIDDLVGPIPVLHYPDRQGAEGVLGIGPFPPEAGEGGLQRLDGDGTDGTHGPSRERSW